MPVDDAAGELGPLEYIWRFVKVVFALSPLIGMVLLFLSSQENTEIERKKRDKEYDFEMQGAAE